MYVVNVNALTAAASSLFRATEGPHEPFDRALSVNQLYMTLLLVESKCKLAVTNNQGHIVVCWKQEH